MLFRLIRYNYMHSRQVNGVLVIIRINAMTPFKKRSHVIGYIEWYAQMHKWVQKCRKINTMSLAMSGKYFCYLETPSTFLAEVRSCFLEWQDKGCNTCLFLLPLLEDIGVGSCG